MEEAVEPEVTENDLFKKIPEPIVGRTHDAKTRSETSEKNNMVDGIKGSTKVKREK